LNKVAYKIALYKKIILVLLNIKLIKKYKKKFALYIPHKIFIKDTGTNGRNIFVNNVFNKIVSLGIITLANNDDKIIFI
jgi:hypothetical protein